MTILTFILVIPAIILFILAITLLVEVTVGRYTIIQESKKIYGEPDRNSEFFVLIPAHNEAEIIESTLSDLAANLGGLDNVLVVADNCSDDTAQMARALGAKVKERHDPNKRGKGYALDYGMQHCDSMPQEIVIILDADCFVHGDSLHILAASARNHNCPVQANYRLHSLDSEAFPVRIAMFAWRVKNFLRPMGLRTMNLPCQLMGTGMAFPRPLLKRINLASGNLVEDMQMGLDLAILGRPPLFEPAASIYSAMPKSDAATKTQRTRWEHGHLQTIFATTPKILLHSILRFDWKLFAMAIDVAVPPLTFFALMLVGGTLIMLIATLFGIYIPALMATLALLVFSSALVICWDSVGRSIIKKSDIRNVFGYVVGKVSVYINFFKRDRPKTWVRTERN